MQSRVPALSGTRICARRRHTMLHTTTCCGMMNNAVLVCIHKISAQAYASFTLRQHAMPHIIHSPTRTSSAYGHKPLLPLPFET